MVSTLTQAPLNAQLDPLFARLMQRWQQKSLAHFYLLSTGPLVDQASEYLQQWVQAFIAQVALKEGSIKKLSDWNLLLERGHPDLCWIDHPANEQQYKQEDAELDELFDFCQHAPFQWSQRFAIIGDGHLINSNYSNKLLKTLEEPSARLTLLLLNPTQQRLLPTIESRAIKLQLKGTAQSNQLHHQIMDQLEEVLKAYWRSERSLTSVLDFIQEDAQYPELLWQFLLQWGAQVPSYQFKQELLEALQWFEHAKLYHNPLQARLAYVLELSKTQAQIATK